uniref:MIF4G domain-containing protein n=1 Tax=Strongyloides papillosus TaxID=174720 RepID=A0A0N5CGJ2_STREA
MPSVYLGAPGANYNYQSGTNNNTNNKGNGYNGNYGGKGNNSTYLTPGVNQTPNGKSSYGGAGTGFGHGGSGNSSYGQNQFGGGGKANSAYYTPTMTNPTGGSGYVADKYSGGGQQSPKGQGSQSQFKGIGGGGESPGGGAGKAGSAYLTPAMAKTNGSSGYLNQKYTGGGSESPGGGGAKNPNTNLSPGAAASNGTSNNTNSKYSGGVNESPGGGGTKSLNSNLSPGIATNNVASSNTKNKYSGGGNESPGGGGTKSLNNPLSPVTAANNAASISTNNKQGGGAQYPSNVQVGQYPFAEQGNENPTGGNGGQSQIKKTGVGGVKDASGYLTPAMANAKDNSGYATNQKFVPRKNQTEEQGTKKHFKENGVGNEPIGSDGAKGDNVNLIQENQNGVSGNTTNRNADDDKNVSRRNGGRSQLKGIAGNPGAEEPESPGGDKTKGTIADPTQSSGNERSKLDKATSTKNDIKTNPAGLVNRNEFVSERSSKATDIKSNNKAIIEDVKSAQMAASMVTAITNSRTSSTTQDSSTLMNTAIHDAHSIETKTGIMIGRTKKPGQKSQEDLEDDDNKYVLLPGDGEDIAKHKANAANNNGDSTNKKKKKKKKKKKDNKVEVHIVYEEVET